MNSSFAISRLLLGFCLLSPAIASDLYVSPSGNDNNPGTLAAPFSTVAKARDTIRALKAQSGLPAGGINVWLRGGNYFSGDTLAFDARDSGTPDRPVVYASSPGEQAHLTGAKSLDPAWFSKVDGQSPVWSRLDPAARGQLYSVDLRAHGISDFGSFKPRGFVLRETAPLELIFNGRSMTLGRWPNRGATLAQTQSGTWQGQIAYAGSRPQRWTQAGDIWLHGLWAQTWADYHVSVASIDTNARTLSLAEGPRQFGATSGQPYYAYNLLEEIDEPGEYYLDRASGLLYFWPTASLSGASISVSMIEQNVVRLSGSQHLTFRDLVIEGSRGALLEIDGGNHNRFERSTLRNAGQYAALISGSNNALDQCEILDCGEEGVRLTGGDRASLTAGNNSVSNSHIQHIGTIAWTYKPGISFEDGCGNFASHNLLEDMPHSGVLFTGNNHIIEFNEITRVCQNTSDAGAIYSGHDWGYRGNVIRNNFIHHIQSSIEGYGAHGVYLDDCMSGTEVSSNIFYRITDTAIFCGGGRDTIMRNNLVAFCGTAHQNDDRGRYRITNSGGDYWNLLERLSYSGIQYQQNPWATAYPACAAIPNSWDAITAGLWRNPENCVFSSNAGWSNGRWTSEQNSSGTGVFSLYASMANNNSSVGALFADGASQDRSQRAVTLNTGLPNSLPIAFAAIGPASASAVQAPAAAVLTVKSTGVSQLELQWSDIFSALASRPIGFELAQQDTSGQWQVIQRLAADATSATVGGLNASTNYTFRLRAFNGVGESFSNVLTLTTAAPPMIPPAGNGSQRVEAEDPLTVVSEVGSNSTIGVADGNLDSGGSVKLYDAGDTIRVSFNLATAGNYQIGFRLRAGGTTGPTAYWPDGYKFKLDGAALAAVGDPTTLSALDPAYGGCYWGTMVSAPLTLAAGNHSVEIAAAANWAVADFVEVTPVGGTVTVPTPTPTPSSPPVATPTPTPTPTATPTPTPTPTPPPVATPTPTPTPIPVVTTPDGPWTNQDIGAVNFPGGSLRVNDAFTLSGSGADIWDNTVGFHYAYQALTGDGIIKVRVMNVQNTDSWAKGGIMIRDSLAPLAPFAAVYLSPGNVASFQWRPQTGYSCSSREVPATCPVWLSLERTGDLIRASISLDGFAWSEIGRATLTFAQKIYVGLALTSHNNFALATANFESVSVTTSVTTPAVPTPTPTPTISAPLPTPTPTPRPTPTPVATPTPTPVSTPVPTPTPTPIPLVMDDTWTSQDVGAVNLPGSTQRSNDAFTLSASGSDIWDNTVGFRYAYQTLTGDGAIKVRVTSVQNTDWWAKAGVMIRDSLNPLAPFAGVYLSPGNVASFQWRTQTGYSCSSRELPANGPVWLSLERTGNLFIASISFNGASWSEIGRAPIVLAQQIYVGLALTSHNNFALATANFESVSVATSVGGPVIATPTPTPTPTISAPLPTPTPTPVANPTPTPTPPSLPSPTPTPTPIPAAADGTWISQDIGAVNFPGSTVRTAAAFTLTGSGADIWDNTVGFHYAYQTMTGDGTITARVLNVQNTDWWAKAGLMIRDSLEPTAAFAGVYLSPSNIASFQWRTQTGYSCSSREISATGPVWLSLERTGDLFKASISFDGFTWTEIGRATIALAQKIYLGLALTSHNNFALGTANFDSVTTSGTSAQTPAEPIAGPALRIEAEDAALIVRDLNLNGTIGISDGGLDSGRSVRLYDAGDTIQIAIPVAATGRYRVAARLRAGGTTGPSAYWPSGYSFKLDSGAITLTGDPATLSALDLAYGGCYWGTMLSDAITLTAGVHVLELSTLFNWAVADYVELVPLSAALTAVRAKTPLIAGPDEPSFTAARSTEAAPFPFAPPFGVHEEPGDRVAERYRTRQKFCDATRASGSPV